MLDVRTPHAGCTSSSGLSVLSQTAADGSVHATDRSTGVLCTRARRRLARKETPSATAVTAAAATTAVAIVPRAGTRRWSDTAGGGGGRRGSAAAGSRPRVRRDGTPIPGLRRHIHTGLGDVWNVSASGWISHMPWLCFHSIPPHAGVAVHASIHANMFVLKMYEIVFDPPCEFLQHPCGRI